MKYILVLVWILLIACGTGQALASGNDPVALFVQRSGLLGAMNVMPYVIGVAALIGFVVMFIRTVKQYEELNRIRGERAREEALLLGEIRRENKLKRDAALRARRQGAQPRR